MLFRQFVERLRSRGDTDGSDELGLVIDIFSRYFWRFRLKYTVIFVCIGITAGATAYIAWFMKDVVNSVFGDAETSKMGPFMAVISLVFIVKGATAYIQTVLSSQISNAMVAALQKRLYDHVLAQRVSFFETHGTDSLVMRFNQGASAINSIMNLLVTKGLADACTLIGLIGLMLWTDWQLTLIAALGGPVVFGSISVILKRIKEVAKSEVLGLEKLNQFVRETVQGVDVVKSYNLEEKMAESADDVIEAVERRRNKIAQLKALPIPLLDTVGGLAVGAAILYAGYRISSGQGDLGTMVSFLTALLLAADPARRLSQLRLGLRHSLIVVGTVYKVLADTRPDASGDKAYEDVVDAKPPAAPSITFDHVHFAYKENGAPVLKDLTFEIKPGEMAALVGPSGAGKSTVLGLTLKFLRPQKGRVLFGGADAAEIRTKNLRDHIAYVGQSSFIFRGSLYENLAFGDESIERERILEACEMVGLGPFIEDLPKGLDSELGELGGDISGGQAQRLNIARAILRDAPVMLLDEVTSALDAENEQLVKDYVLSQQGKKTMLAIAHRLSTVKGADKIVLLDKGRVLDIGRHEELVERNEYYAKVVSLQFD